MPSPNPGMEGKAKDQHNEAENQHDGEKESNTND